MRLQGAFGNARLALQVDVGFGDVVTPRPAHLAYPSTLDADWPRLLAYTPETSIAETLQNERSSSRRWQGEQVVMVALNIIRSILSRG